MKPCGESDEAGRRSERAGSSFRVWCFANFSAALRSSGKNEGGDIDFAVYSIPSRAYQALRYGMEYRRVEIGSHPPFFPELYRPRKASPPLGMGLADVTSGRAASERLENAKRGHERGRQPGASPFRCGDFGRTCLRRQSNDCRAGPRTP